MLFNKNEGRVNDRVLYRTKPNMILGCKKAIYGAVLLIIVLIVSSMTIKFIGGMQVYLISSLKLSLTRYAAIAFFVIILINVIYIIWQLVGWYFMEYTLTETKIIVKSGVISTKRSYMPYSTIQDINTSQNIICRLFNVGSISLFSAYDNNQLEINYISNPSYVEEIIFSKMTGSNNFQTPHQSMRQYSEMNYSNDNEHYDEYEPITPVKQENYSHREREYEYYPDDFENVPNRSPHSYEYEPYDSKYNRSSNDFKRESYHDQITDDYSYDSKYNRASNDFKRESYHDQMTDDYSYEEDNYYNNNDSQNYYEQAPEYSGQNDADDTDDSSDVIQRHFDKFKK